MTGLPDPPDERVSLELVARIQAGEGECWDQLYRRYHDELLLTVRTQLGARLRSVLESEDVLQSVALEAFQALPRFEPRGADSLRHFLHRLVLNKIRDRADTWKAWKRDPDQVQPVEALDHLADPRATPTYFSEAYARLEQALARLPDDMRRVIALRRFEGYSSREIAERDGRTDAAVRKLFSRAMARLTTELTGK